MDRKVDNLGPVLQNSRPRPQHITREERVTVTPIADKPQMGQTWLESFLIISLNIEVPYQNTAKPIRVDLNIIGGN